MDKVLLQYIVVFFSLAIPLGACIYLIARKPNKLNRPAAEEQE